MKARKTTARTYRFTGLLLVDPAALSIVNNLIKTEAVRILILGFVSPGIVKKKKKKKTSNRVQIDSKGVVLLCRKYTSYG